MKKNMFVKSNSSKFKEEFIEAVKESYKIYNKKNIYKAMDRLKQLKTKKLVYNIELFIAGDEILDEGIFNKELNIIGKLLILLKVNYENAEPDIISDRLYDKMLIRYKLFREEQVEGTLMISNKATLDTEHEYPLLKGTLDKCNFIVDKNNYHDSLEKFIDKCFEVIDRYNLPELMIRTSLKYDGVSSVFSLDEKGKIYLAVTRGKNGKGANMTHLTKGLKYPKTRSKLGLKVEWIVTNKDLKLYSKEKDYPYANSRVAATSILTALDGAKYSKYLTPVPLDAVTKNDYRLTPLELNKAFDVGVPYIFNNLTFKNKETCLKELKNAIVNIALKRDTLGFPIDGVVIEASNPEIIYTLGRKGMINQYQIAYKFPSEEHATDVIDVGYQVGRTGLVVPIVYYKDIYFNGTKHDHSTLSSYKRFNELNLCYGDEILVTYNNDVMPYVNYVTNDKGGSKIHFTKTCPICDAVLVDKGANKYCTNPMCGGKLVLSLTNFIKVLGYKGISDKTVEALVNNKVFESFETLLKPDVEKLKNMDGIADTKFNMIMNFVIQTKKRDIPEDLFAQALGLSGLKTCTLILSKMSLLEILVNPDKLYYTQIRSIDKLKKKAFIDKLNLLNVRGEVERLYDILNIVPPIENVHEYCVCFSGFRDKEFKENLEAKYNIGVVDSLKDIAYLVVPDLTFQSSKTTLADKRDIQIVDIEQFKNIINYKE